MTYAINHLVKLDIFEVTSLFIQEKNLTNVMNASTLSPDGQRFGSISLFIRETVILNAIYARRFINVLDISEDIS